jgi:hypothetical protein
MEATIANGAARVKSSNELAATRHDLYDPRPDETA